MTRNYGKQIKFHTLTIKNLVPENHFLLKLDRLVDFSFIYEETKEYYCHHNGRPSIDPVILVETPADRIPLRYRSGTAH